PRSRIVRSASCSPSGPAGSPTSRSGSLPKSSPASSASRWWSSTSPAPAASTVMKAAPDGHTLLVLTNGTAISKSLFKSLPFDPVKDFAPVSLVAYFDIVIVTSPESKYQTLGDLLAAARSNPGKLNFGTINPGSTQNLSAELFRSTAGIDVVIVPFRTSPDAATALMGGNLDAVFESYTALKSLVAARKLRALATTGNKRSVYLPDLPTA